MRRNKWASGSVKNTRRSDTMDFSVKLLRERSKGEEASWIMLDHAALREQLWKFPGRAKLRKMFDSWENLRLSTRKSCLCDKGKSQRILRQQTTSLSKRNAYVVKRSEKDDMWKISHLIDASFESSVVIKAFTNHTLSRWRDEKRIVLCLLFSLFFF